MNLKITINQFSQARGKLKHIENSIPHLARTWTHNSIENLDYHLKNNLQTQGRNGKKPPLSSATEKIYRATKQPDGSGIRNHIELSYYQKGDRYIGVLGIAPGKPTTVAKVQEHGAYIKVTQKMRNYLAVVGIFLRADTTHIRVPPRRFWSKGNATANTEAKQELKRLFAQLCQFKT